MTTDNRPESTEEAASTRSRPGGPAADRMRSQARKVATDLQEMGNIAHDAVQENLGQMRDNSSEYFEHRCDEVHKAEHTFETFIKDRPFKSILIAAGVGWFLGRFWKRR
jgi:ElaB/YqjD/DUF883 family membrane-anchored ribosome-binding protein